MTPNDLINGLRYLAEQCPVEAVCFRVPSAPACTNHHMRLDATPRDIMDLLDMIKGLQDIVSGNVSPASEWSNQP